MKKANEKPVRWETECVGELQLEDIIIELLKLQLREDIENANNAKKVA